MPIYTDLLTQLRCAGLPEPSEEHLFHPPRKWRFDYAYPSAKIAIEVEGGLHVPGGGRHNRAQGFQKDIDKYNRATLLGWRVFRVTYKMIREGSALTLIERALVAVAKERKRFMCDLCGKELVGDLFGQTTADTVLCEQCLDRIRQQQRDEGEEGPDYIVAG